MAYNRRKGEHDTEAGVDMTHLRKEKIKKVKRFLVITLGAIIPRFLQFLVTCMCFTVLANVISRILSVAEYDYMIFGICALANMAVMFFLNRTGCVKVHHYSRYYISSLIAYAGFVFVVYVFASLQELADYSTLIFGVTRFAEKIPGLSKLITGDYFVAIYHVLMVAVIFLSTLGLHKVMNQFKQHHHHHHHHHRLDSQ